MHRLNRHFSATKAAQRPDVAIKENSSGDEEEGWLKYIGMGKATKPFLNLWDSKEPQREP